MRREAVLVAAILCAAAPYDRSAAAADPFQDPSAVPSRQEIFKHLHAHDLNAAGALLDQYLEAHPDDPVMLYNAACVEAQLGRIDVAERRLLDSIKAGFDGFSHMQRDPDIAPLRDGRMYRAIINARRAAGPLLVDRRAQYWRERFSLDPASELPATDHLIFVTESGQGPPVHLIDACESLIALIETDLFEQSWSDQILVIMPDDISSDSLFASEHAHGVYQHDDRVLVARATDEALRHELVHAAHEMHMDALGQQHAIWIREGLASLFENIRFDDSTGSLSFPPNDRDRIARLLLESDQLKSWSEIMAMTDSQFESDRAEHYSTVRTMFAFLAEVGKLEAWYASYVSGFEEDSTGRAAIGLVFARPVDDIDAEWRAWLSERDEETKVDEVTGKRGEDAAVGQCDPSSTSSLRLSVSSSLPPDYAEAASLYESCRPRLLEEYAPAVPDLERVIQLHPHHASARYDLGLACILLGDIAGAHRAREALRALDENLANLLSALLRE